MAFFFLLSAPFSSSLSPLIRTCFHATFSIELTVGWVFGRSLYSSSRSGHITICVFVLRRCTVICISFIFNCRSMHVYMYVYVCMYVRTYVCMHAGVYVQSDIATGFLSHSYFLASAGVYCVCVCVCTCVFLSSFCSPFILYLMTVRLWAVIFASRVSYVINELRMFSGTASRHRQNGFCFPLSGYVNACTFLISVTREPRHRGSTALLCKLPVMKLNHNQETKRIMGCDMVSLRHFRANHNNLTGLGSYRSLLDCDESKNTWVRKMLCNGATVVAAMGKPRRLNGSTPTATGRMVFLIPLRFFFVFLFWNDFQNAEETEDMRHGFELFPAFVSKVFPY